jgi:hypothetical protein
VVLHEGRDEAEALLDGAGLARLVRQASSVP